MSIMRCLIPALIGVQIMFILEKFNNPVDPRTWWVVFVPTYQILGFWLIFWIVNFFLVQKKTK